ncbi:MAG: trigger factor [Hyphomonadaceae bacterium]|nr:trigger factor [Clostridia bacterium]
MQTKLEQIEKNIVKLTIEVSTEKFEEGVQKSYLKNAKKYNIPGFRKGKAPRKMLERYYGEGIFYEDAINFVCPEAYDNAVQETGIEPIDRPEIDIDNIGVGEILIFTAKVTVKPEVVLGDYKGIEVEKVAYNVTDEQVNAEINKMLEKNSRMVTIEDRAILDGDIVNMDFEGFVDDVAFPGGKGDAFDLTIGSGQFIPGFEEQLVGKSIGEDIDVNVSFPTEYHAEELAGKPALFKVKINSIKAKELPAVDDEFAKDVSEFDTLEALKADILQKQTEIAQKREKDELETSIMDKAVSNATVEIPDVMVETQIDQSIRDFEMRLKGQGLEFEQYMQYSGMDMDAMREQFKAQAQKQVKNTLIIEKIAKTENIEITEDDIEAEFAKIADMYKMEVDKVKEMMTGHLDSLKEDIAFRKAIEYVVSQAVVK